MAITLRSSKSQALTFTELDGNFSDLDGRVVTLEGSVVKTVNGVSPSSNALTLTSANISEVTNLYFTDARARAAVSVTDAGGDGSLSYNSSSGVITYTGPSASEVRAHFSAGEGIDISSGTVSGEDASTSNKGIASFSSSNFDVSSGAVSVKADGINDTHIDFGTGANQVSTADIPEQTNLYYTDGRVTTRINATSITALTDVLDTALDSPTDGHGLVFNAGSGKIELAELPGAAGGEANTGSNIGGANEVFQGKAGVDFKFRTLDHGDNISITQSSQKLTIELVSAPEFGNLKINSAANTIENISTNANIILKPNGTGVVKSEGNIIIPNAGNIGSVGDTDAIAISASGVVTMNQIPVFSAGINVSGGSIAGTLSTAAQTNITTVGTLTTLTVDNVIINGTTIGHTSDDDLITLASGQVTLAGALDVGSNNFTTDGITIATNTIRSSRSNDNLVLLTSGTGKVEVDSQIDMNSNKIVNVTDPGSAQDAATKAYVDAQVSSLSSDKINEGNSKVEVVDSGTGSVVINVDATDRITTVAATTTTATGHSIVLGAASNSAGGSIKFLEGTDNGTNGVTLQGPASTADVTVLLPASADTLVGKATTDTLTNKTIDANGTGNNISNIDIGNMTAAVVVTEAEGIGSNDNDTTLPTSAAVKDFVDTAVAAVSTTAISQGNSNVTVVDSGTGQVQIDVDGTDRLVVAAATTTTATGHSLVMGATSTTVGGKIKFLEGTDNGTNGVTLVGAASTADVDVVLPSTAGTLALQNEDTTGTAAIATTITLVATNSTDASHFPVFVDTATGNENPRTDSGFTYNPSSGTLTSTIFAGTANQAKYADLAENYLTDTSIIPGTVVCVGGDAEVTTANEDTEILAGVISTNPAYLMNSAQENGQPVALVGRVPVRVIGSVNKGDAVFADNGGVASKEASGPIVGVALESSSITEEKLIECLLKV